MKHEEEKPWKLYWSNAKRVWLARWREALPDGRPTWKNRFVPCEITNEEQASEWMAQWWSGQRINASAPAPVVRPTVSHVFGWWVGYLKEERKDERAAKDALGTKRRWIEPFPFASVPIDELRIEHCVDWIEAVQRSGRADFTVRNIVATVRTFLSDARGKGRYRGENFFLDPYVKRRLRGAQPKAGKDVIVHLSPEDVRKMVTYDGEVVPTRRHARNVLAVLTGLRKAEVNALRWCDVDLDGKCPVVRVHRQLVMKEGQPTFKPPKRGSKRTVPLHPHVVRLLKRWRDEWRAHTGVGRTDESPVFAGEGGTYADDFRPRELRMDLAAYGASPLYEGEHPITVHALRRTCLTMLTNANVNDNDVKRIAGHAKAGVTQRHYVAENLERLAKGINRMLAHSTSERVG